MIGSQKYPLSANGCKLHEDTVKIIDQAKYSHITNPCLTGDTIIDTRDGNFTIKELVGKRFTIIYDDCAYDSTEDGFWSNGIKRVYELTTECGHTIKATLNHKFYQYRVGWIEVKDLKPDDIIMIKNGSARIILIQECGEEEVFDCTIKHIHRFIANGFMSHNCGEANLNIRGAYCTLSDIVPFFCDTLDEVKETAKLATRFLIRTNLMNAIYADEVKRTNRIGLGITAIHEFAWKFFHYGFRDLIDETKSQDFWNFINELRITIEEEGCRYSDELGVNHPHTFNVVKPSGSISKLFALTEGAHLPAYRWYLRWVQFQNNDPLLQEYKDKGYPVKLLVSYPNVSIVGFLTKPLICSLGMGDKLVTAQEATPEEQYKWIMLLEKYWLGPNGGQCSYTLKIATDKVSLEQFREMFRKYQPLIRCCTVLPTISTDTLKTIYEYLPEEEITEEKYSQIENQINSKSEVQFNVEELMCAGGACPL